MNLGTKLWSSAAVQIKEKPLKNLTLEQENTLPQGAEQSYNANAPCATRVKLSHVCNELIFCYSVGIRDKINPRQTFTYILWTDSMTNV